MGAFDVVLLSVLFSPSVLTHDDRASCRAASFVRQFRSGTESPISDVIAPSLLSCVVSCSKNTECQAFHFKVDTRSCRLYHRISTPSGTHTDGDRIVYVKEPTTLPVSVHTTVKPAVAVKRFLIASNKNPRCHQLLVRGDTATVTPYNHIKLKGVVKLQYSTELKMIFLNYYHSKRVLAFRLDSNIGFKVASRFYPQFSVDGKNGLFFGGYHNELHRMTVNGTKFKVLSSIRKGGYFNNVANDGERVFITNSNPSDESKRLYFLSVLNYSGKFLWNVISYAHYPISLLAVNPTSPFIVHNLKNSILLYDMTSKKHSLLTSNLTDVHVDIYLIQQIMYAIDGNSLIMYPARLGQKKVIEIPKLETIDLFSPIY